LKITIGRVTSGTEKHHSPAVVYARRSDLSRAPAKESPTDVSQSKIVCRGTSFEERNATPRKKPAGYRQQPRRTPLAILGVSRGTLYNKIKNIAWLDAGGASAHPGPPSI
jgi:hypothetical protein